MTKRLAGKTALVTAAGQGIGRAIAEAFVREGAIVWATDIDAAKLKGIARARRRKLDVTKPRAIAAFAEKTGPIDILANIAGFVHHGSILEATDADWDFAFDLNVRGMHNTMRAFLPGMVEKGGGSIINMSSGAGALKGAAARYVYGATKAAVIGQTKSVAADFITKGVRANCICPGVVHSPSWEDRVAALGEAMGSEQKAREAFIARQPMGRIGTPAEIAALAVYLASDESAYTTGTAIPIDGGWTL